MLNVCIFVIIGFNIDTIAANIYVQKLLLTKNLEFLISAVQKTR